MKCPDCGLDVKANHCNACGWQIQVAEHSDIALQTRLQAEELSQAKARQWCAERGLQTVEQMRAYIRANLPKVGRLAKP